jgi:hypothetical protein
MSNHSDQVNRLNEFSLKGYRDEVKRHFLPELCAEHLASAQSSGQARDKTGPERDWDEPNRTIVTR